MDRNATMHGRHGPLAFHATLVLVGFMAMSGGLWEPGRAHAAVAGKTYDLWWSFAPGVSAPPQHTCLRFTATTIQLDACGPQAGALTESAVTPITTGWVGQVPCEGLDLALYGAAVDGLMGGFQANVLAGVGLSTAGRLAISLEGVENPACQ
jgi:hypothetical protein